MLVTGTKHEEFCFLNILGSFAKKTHLKIQPQALRNMDSWVQWLFRSSTTNNIDHEIRCVGVCAAYHRCWTVWQKKTVIRRTGCFYLPVPPAIMPTCLAVLVTAGDFLSGWMAKTPGTWKEMYRIRSGCTDRKSDNCSSTVSRYQATQFTFALVNEKTAGSSKVNSVVDLEALQVLTHLPTLRKFRINAFEVNLLTKETCLEQ